MLLRAHKVDVLDLRAQRLNGATFASIDAGGNTFVWRLTAAVSAERAARARGKRRPERAAKDVQQLAAQLSPWPQSVGMELSQARPWRGLSFCRRRGRM